MNIPKNRIKDFCVISCLLSAVFLFFNWITLDIPILGSFLESSSFSISFFTLPKLIEENVLGLITRLAGKPIAITVILLCGMLKYLCVLSLGFSVWGTWEMYMKKGKTRFVFSSLVISLALAVLSFLVIIVVNILIYIYSPAISEMIGFTDSAFKLRFVPTVWLILSFLLSLASSVFLYLFSKE